MTPPIKTHISRRGYALTKADASPEELQALRDALTVSPKVNRAMMGANAEPLSFPVYLESSKKLYAPRCFGLARYGLPTDGDALRLEDVPSVPEGRLVFTGSLRPEQLAPVKAFLDAAADPLRRGGIISLQCGGGKCLGIDTPVLMHDGTVKKVQYVLVGDVLMGDDSTPRHVLSLARGRETMVRVVPTQGDPYVVNASHILSLRYEQGDVVDMSVQTYMGLPKQHHGPYGPLYGFRVPVNFPTRPVDMDPYSLGYALGVDTCNASVLSHLYKCNSREVRMHVLAGVLDACGAYDAYHYDVSLKSEQRVEDVLYLARSLGFAAYKIRRTTKCIIYGEGMQHIPVKIACKTAAVSQLKNALNVGILLEPLGEDDYYGFAIDGNRRFVLGDFTVTHNTVLGLHLTAVLQKPTLVVCHTEFLVNQWMERIAQFLPGARVGRIQKSVVDVQDRDIVLASLQSLAMKSYDADVLNRFGFVIIDECHHTSAAIFSRALAKITAPVMLGLSATPKRKDGLTCVFEWFLGPMVFQTKKRAESDLKVTCDVFVDDNPQLSAATSGYGCEHRLYAGFGRGRQAQLNFSKMVNSVCDHAPRNDLIVSWVQRILKQDPGRHVLILSERRGHLLVLEGLLRAVGYTSIGRYLGGMKDAALKESAKCQILLATTQLMSEGADIPALNTLIFGSPITSIEQPIGRIQRQKACERQYVPWVIDLVDAYSVFESQAKRRRAFYKKNKYSVVPWGTSEVVAENESDSDSEEAAVATKVAGFVLEDDA